MRIIRDEMFPALGEDEYEWPRGYLQVHPAWPSLVDNFVEQMPALSRERPPVMLVMGVKDVGKSSCCKYFVNALLNHSTEVFFLETDLGQPEFSAPGLVTLHRLRSPVLDFGTRPHHGQGSGDGSVPECVASFFAGAVTPSVHPLLYIRSVRAAFDKYLELAQKGDGSPIPPLIVNSHGWATGLGLELVQTILGIVEAQLVLRIGHQPPDCEGLVLKRKRPLLAKCGPLALALKAESRSQSDSPPCVLVDIGSLAWGSKVTVASDLRWARFARLFHKDRDLCSMPKGKSPRDFFGSVPRLRLPLNKLRFGWIHEGHLRPDEVESCFTGMLVALCTLKDSKLNMVTEKSGPEEAGATDDCKPSVFEIGNSVAHCVSMAYVHSFDFARGALVACVATASAAELEEAWCDEPLAVMRGDFTWDPHCIRGLNVIMEDLPEGAKDPNPLQPFCSSWTLEGLACGARMQSNRRGVKRKPLFPPRQGGGGY